MNLKFFAAAALALRLVALPAAAAEPPRAATLDDASLIGQLMTVWFRGPILSEELKQMIRQYRIGGVILFANADNIHSVDQIVKLNSDIQRYAAACGLPPLFIAIDQEGGRVNRLNGVSGCTAFPAPGDLASLDDVRLVRAAASAVANQLRELGVNWNCVPCLDLNTNPQNPIIGIRSFGADAEKAAIFGQAVIEAHRAAGVLTSIKHFPGHGDTSVDSHLQLPKVDRSSDELKKIELAPFKKDIRFAPAVMVGHLLLPAIDPQYPATMSRKIISILRNDWKYKGLIVSDSMGMKALTLHWPMPESARMALNAGIDILIYGNDGHTRNQQILVIESLRADLKAGRLSRKAVTTSVKRIIKVKEELLLFENAMPRLKQGKVPETPADARLAAHITELLKAKNAH